MLYKVAGASSLFQSDQLGVYFLFLLVSALFLFKRLFFFHYFSVYYLLYLRDLILLVLLSILLYGDELSSLFCNFLFWTYLPLLILRRLVVGVLHYCGFTLTSLFGIKTRARSFGFLFSCDWIQRMIYFKSLHLLYKKLYKI